MNKTRTRTFRGRSSHREDRVGLVVERAVAILTQIPLILSIAAVIDHRLRLTARAIEAIVPANLLQQVRGTRL